MSDNDNVKIEPGDLLAYAAGELSQEKRALIDADPALAAEARALAELDDAFDRAVRRVDCPPVEDLLAYEAGLHPTVYQRQIATHVEACGACRSELAELEAAGKAIEDAAGPAGETVWERLRDRVARIIPAVPMPVGDRPVLSVRGPWTRRERYVADPYEITLAIDPGPGTERRWQIQGHIRRLDNAPLALDPGARVLLAGPETAEAMVDKMGLFNVDTLPVGAYDVIVYFDQMSAATFALSE